MIDIGITLALILSGFLLVWISQKAKLGFGDVSKAAIILLPLVLYLVLTGKVSEFEALGWKAKFREAVTENVVKTARASDLMISNPDANKPNFYMEAFWQTCRPYYVLTDKTAKTATGDLDQDAAINIAIAIRSSIVCGHFTGLVVVDNDGKPVGLFLSEHFLEILRIPLVTYNAQPVSAAEAYRQIAASELGVVLSNPIIRARSDDAEHVSIEWDSDLESTYKIMLEKNVTVAMIRDRLGRFDGIITRSVIEGRILEKLLAASK